MMKDQTSLGLAAAKVTVLQTESRVLVLVPLESRVIVGIHEGVSSEEMVVKDADAQDGKAFKEKNDDTIFYQTPGSCIKGEKLHADPSCHYLRKYEFKALKKVCIDSKAKEKTRNNWCLSLKCTKRRLEMNVL